MTSVFCFKYQFIFYVDYYQKLHLIIVTRWVVLLDFLKWKKLFSNKDDIFMQPNPTFFFDEGNITLVLTSAVICLVSLSSLCSMSQPFISVLEIKSFILTWLLSKSTSDNCDKVGGSFRLCDIDEVGFRNDPWIHWLFDCCYPNCNCFWWSAPKWFYLCDVCCLQLCLDGHYYPSIWLVNGSFIVFSLLPVNKESTNLANSASTGRVMAYK